jgi:hypothetical protein
MTLEAREALDVVYSIKITTPAALTKTNLSFGKFVAFWRTTSTLSDKWSRLVDVIAPIQISASPLLMHIGKYSSYDAFKMTYLPLVLLDIQHDAQVGCTLPAIYSFQNMSMDYLDFQVSMESNEHFVYSGYKAHRVKLLPMSTKTLAYHFVPLSSGSLPLPLLRIAQEDMESIKDVDVLVAGGQVGTPHLVAVLVKPFVGW